ncbi:right-handed parallel beta-helix repeat-containing protein [Candidatus Sumerlaeota bacterium]|nr:right-handed parallel beta-helix repeat-containing protein [Candidatus Sumerlaeota bacterium]
MNTIVDENGTGDDLSLREAIALAADSDNIIFAPNVVGHEISLTNGQLEIQKPLTIQGAVRVNANNLSRVFAVSHTSGVVKITGLTVKGGNTVEDGGGILSNGGGELQLVECALIGNAAANGGGISNQSGSKATIERSLIKDNSAIGMNAFGGGVDNFNGATVLVSNSTIANNSISGNGAGIANSGGGAQTKVVNCTIVSNDDVGGGFGGGIFNATAAGFAIGNSIVLSNTLSDASPADAVGSESFASRGGNYIATSPSDIGFTHDVNGDQVGSVAVPLPSVIGSFGDYGGPTGSYPLIYPSDAVDRGNQALLVAENFPSGQNFDQRGQTFMRQGIVDIGAREVDPEAYIVDTLVDENDGVAVGGVSLREATAAAPAGSTIQFASALLPSGSTPSVFQLMNNASITISKPMTIVGLGARVMSVRAGLNSRIFELTHAVGTTKISGMTITGGNTGTSGGAMRVVGGGDLHLVDCSVSESDAHSSTGSGIYMTDSSATIERCAIINNGGSGTPAGGGIYSRDSKLLVTNSTISGNEADSAGGGIYTVGGETTVVNCTIVNNLLEEGTDGAGIGTADALSIGNTIIERNDGVGSFFELHSGGTITTLGGNYLSRHWGGLPDQQSSDQLGTFESPLPSVTNPTLFDNGGPTMTHALIFPSRAVGVGNNSLLVEDYFPSGNYDQVGEPRIGQIDIGAVEARPSAVTITTEVDEFDGVAFGNGISLREALDCVETGRRVFAPSGSITPFFQLTRGELLIERSVTILRDDEGPITINGDRTSRIMRIITNPFLMEPSAVQLRNCTVSGGGDSESGGGIYVEEGVLTLDRCTISDNEAEYGAGLAIEGSFSGAIINASTISGNRANQDDDQYSGGIDVYGNAFLEINNSTISGNSAQTNGGIVIERSSANITNCTIVGNRGRSPTDSVGGVALINSDDVMIADTIIQMNHAAFDPSFDDIFIDEESSAFSNGGNYMGVVPIGYPFASQVRGDQAGTVENPLAAAVEEELSNHGGPTKVHFPLNPGPAIDTGKETLTVESQGDQRGSARRFGSQHDIGAVEWSPFVMDGFPDDLLCPPTNGFQIAENDGWVYASVDKPVAHTCYLLFGENPHNIVTVDNSSLSAANWDFYFKMSGGAFQGLYDELNAVVINPDPDRFAFVNGSFQGGDRFEVVVRKQFIGNHRTFVAIVEMDGNNFVAQYPVGDGSPVARGEYLPVITGTNTCFDLQLLREMVVDHLLGFPFQPPRGPVENPFDYLGVNDDAIIDATDASYLER